MSRHALLGAVVLVVAYVSPAVAQDQQFLTPGAAQALSVNAGVGSRDPFATLAPSRSALQARLCEGQAGLCATAERDEPTISRPREPR